MAKIAAREAELAAMVDTRTQETFRAFASSEAHAHVVPSTTVAAARASIATAELRRQLAAPPETRGGSTEQAPWASSPRERRSETFAAVPSGRRSPRQEAEVTRKARTFVGLNFCR
jgi:hypothetical protein